MHKQNGLLYWMSQAKRTAFPRILTAVCVSTSMCAGGRENKGVNKQKMRALAGNGWMCQPVYFGLHSQRQHSPIRAATEDCFSPNNVTFSTKNSLCDTAAQIGPQALTQSLVHIIIPQVQMSSSADQFASKVLSVSSSELWGLLWCQGGQRCLCISRSDCSAGLKGKRQKTGLAAGLNSSPAYCQHFL